MKKIKNGDYKAVEDTYHYKSIPNSMTVGGSYTVPKADGKPYHSWSVTSNSSNATITGSTITAKKTGTAIITLTGTAGSTTNKATKKITIINKPIKKLAKPKKKK